MFLSKKLQKWVIQGVITQEQADKITELEQTNHTSLAWRAMFLIAGLFIGLGFILLVGANWDDIPSSIKLLGDFTIWAGVLYGVYWSVTQKKENIRELFLVLSFLMVGATIGLIGQIFNLSGGWQSFSMTWALLSIPFVLMSRMLSLNIVWLILLCVGVDWEPVLKWLLFREDHLVQLIFGTISLALIGYAGRKLYEETNKIIVLPKALSKLSLFAMYIVAILGGAALGLGIFMANVFVLVFLGIRMGLAFMQKDTLSFRNNTLLLELFIFFLFVSRFGDLFMTGIGFIFAGVLLLLLIYGLRKTSSRIKQFDWRKINEQ